VFVKNQFYILQSVRSQVVLLNATPIIDRLSLKNYPLKKSLSFFPRHSQRRKKSCISANISDLLIDKNLFQKPLIEKSLSKDLFKLKL